MKSTSTLIVLVFALVSLSGITLGQSPPEQLSQLVAELQKTTTDNALREKIIKLAVTMKPPPAIPDEAERRMARGAAAFKGAKSVVDYQDAIKEFQAAVDAAPWYGDAYFNLGVTQDKAEKYSDALQNLKWAQMASPDAKDIKTLTYEVEYRNEKASPASQAGKENQQFREFMRSLDGYVFVGPWSVGLPGERFRYKTKIQGDQMAIGQETVDATGTVVHAPKSVFGEQFTIVDSILVDSYELLLKNRGCVEGTGYVLRDAKITIDRAAIILQICGTQVVMKAKAAAKRYEGEWYSDFYSNGLKDRVILTIKHLSADSWTIDRRDEISGTTTNTNPNFAGIKFDGTKLIFRNDRGDVEYEVGATLDENGSQLSLTYTPIPFATPQQAAHWAGYGYGPPKQYTDVYKRL